jgi:D-alanyl-D-alanine carboxypeptidase/D-alanyl-D-alanine-endopeptidase (penicillin-binding protein 4)
MRNLAAFAGAVDDIVARFGSGCRVGIAIHASSDGELIFERDASMYFHGASTAKLPTVASALVALGPDFRFRTTIRHTGWIDGTTLHGDLMLVASGDPNLSARVRPDGTLTFADVDHLLSGTRGAAAVPGDPLVVMRGLARSVAARLTHITGRVAVDVSLFPEGTREQGTMAVISPIVVNDNVIDIIATAPDQPGEPVTIATSPRSTYITFVCEAVAADAATEPALTFSAEEIDASGTRIVRITGTAPAGSVQLYAHPVASPSGFARTLLSELLAESGVTIGGMPSGEADAGANREQVAPTMVAEHISPPFAEAAKIILKVSQNLHAALCPYLVGAYRDGVRGEAAEAAGFARLQRFLESAGVDMAGIVQGDAYGYHAYVTPSFMCRLLRTIATLPIGATIRAALPVLGRDGTLHEILPRSPAAGNVVAKTGTHGFEDRLRPRRMVIAKGLAGYIHASSGNAFAFAAYANLVPLEPGETWAHIGTALGEIAAAAHATL